MDKKLSIDSQKSKLKYQYYGKESWFLARIYWHDLKSEYKDLQQLQQRIAKEFPFVYYPILPNEDIFIIIPLLGYN